MANNNAASQGRKLFVGSLPHNCSDQLLRGEFSKFGAVEDVFVKPHCEIGRQWAFVTLATAEAASMAKDACDRILHFQGSERPCDVMIAKGGGDGRSPMGGGGGATMPGASYGMPMATVAATAPRKIFVGSLPSAISDADLRNEFSKYGQIQDCHLNNKPCEAGRQWAFISFASPEQAQLAKESADKLVMFPGSEKACEVTLARHQGMYGQDSLGGEGGGQSAGAQPMYAAGDMQEGPRKIFVGSLPQTVTQELLQAEFSKYGQVQDVHINYKACETGRNWAFVTFASHEQASYAKDATDRVLMVPGADRACEVMLAKNQGRNGQEPMSGGARAPVAAVAGFAPPPAAVYMQPAMQFGGAQPPPPSVPPPPSLTPWRMYKTAAGLPYYHNHSTGATVWECPPDLQVPGQGAYGAAAMAVHQVHYAPY